MSRDYARKPRNNRSATSSAPTKKSAPKRKASSAARQSVAKAQHGGLSLKWILSLATVGGFIGFIVYLNSLPSPTTDTKSSQPATSEQTNTSEQATSKQKDEKPGFKFYDMLPDSEVVTPNVEEYTPGPGQTDFDYLVQTGSFRTKADAERQRAQIAFQGLRAYVKQIDLDNGSTWYRVNVGPFTSRSQMNSAVDKLVSINIEPLVRKVPKEG